MRRAPLLPLLLLLALPAAQAGTIVWFLDGPPGHRTYTSCQLGEWWPIRLDAEFESFEWRVVDAAGAVWAAGSEPPGPAPVYPKVEARFEDATGRWPDGSYRLEMELTDAEGTASDEATFDLVPHEDLLRPRAQSWVEAPGVPRTDGWYLAPVTLVVSGEDECRMGSLEALLNGVPAPLWPWETGGPVLADFRFETGLIQSTPLAEEGRHRFLARAIDHAGNEGWWILREILVDPNPPHLAFTNPRPGTLNLWGWQVDTGMDETLVVQCARFQVETADPGIGLRASPFGPGPDIRWEVSPGPWYGESWNTPHDHAICFEAPGIHTVTVRTWDRAGREASAEFTVRVLG